jgi:hypothetical protein
MQKKIFKKLRSLFSSTFSAYVVIIILSSVLFSFIIAGDPFNETTVSISPENQIVGPGKSFTVEVYCVPGQPIKGYELGISFNPSLIKAVSVEEGDIFDGFNTFFNSGTIDNSEGTIKNIFGLILGAGDVSEPGTFVKISFTSKSNTGSSELVLNDVGVTNETEYVSVSVDDGILQVDASTPEISYVTSTPPSQESSGFVNISTVVTDNLEVELVCLNIYYPDDSFENITITENKIGDTYFYNKTYNMVGLYSYYIWAKDGVDNGIVSSSNNFYIGDVTPPEISNILFSKSNPIDTDSDFGWVNITCDVTDNIEVVKVYLHKSYNDGSWNSVLFNSCSGSSYYYNSSTLFSQAGNYSYYILAYDVANNTDVSVSNTFSIPTNWDINKDGKVNILDLVLVSNSYSESGNPGWIREDVDNNGEVQLIDLSIVSNHYDETWWN